jgi:hypothetical protein
MLSLQLLILEFPDRKTAYNDYYICFIFPEQYNIECSGKGGTPEPTLIAAVGRADDTFDEEGKEDKLLEPLEHSFLQNPDTGEVTYLQVRN